MIDKKIDGINEDKFSFESQTSMYIVCIFLYKKSNAKKVGENIKKKEKEKHSNGRNQSEEI